MKVRSAVLSGVVIPFLSGLCWDRKIKFSSKYQIVNEPFRELYGFLHSFLTKTPIHKNPIVHNVRIVNHLADGKPVQ